MDTTPTVIKPPTEDMDMKDMDSDDLAMYLHIERIYVKRYEERRRELMKHLAIMDATKTAIRTPWKDITKKRYGGLIG